MANEPNDRILGDIRPRDEARGDASESGVREERDEKSMQGGSQHDRTDHAGSRDVTEGTTGGTGAEVGGTRNYRQGTGATGTDIGNRPE
jgi:hypothetical protein